MTALRSERGQASVLAIGAALVAFAVAGVTIDGTRAFLFRRSLQNAADAAALAGASEIDVETFYAGGGARAVLDPAAARATAIDWLRRRGLDAVADVDADDGAVEVTLRGRIGTTLLALVGIDDVPVAAAARAEPLPGRPAP
ncbi:MAG TPA: pilus assembly protein TadG-related protein [Actinomycetota bacterium]|nr:pilus assembly protein TadG-related protein [Actinomycetota bacterium]